VTSKLKFINIIIIIINISIISSRNIYSSIFARVKWVPVIAAWRVPRLIIVELRPIWNLAANILNKQELTTVNGCSFRLGVEQRANNASLLKRIVLLYISRQASELY